MIRIQAVFFYLLFLIVNSAHCIAQTSWNDSLSALAGRLSNQLKPTNKTVAIYDFTDTRSGQGELGRTVAAMLRVELAKNMPSKIINRDFNVERTQERRDISYKKSIGKQSANDEKLKGIDYFLKGKMAFFDDYIYVVIEIVDYNGGIVAIGESTRLPRITDNATDPIPAEAKAPIRIETANQSAIDFVMEAKISDMRPGECKREYYGDLLYSGQICFENQTGEDLIFYSKDFNPSERLDDYKMALPNRGRNCSRFIVANFDNLTRKVNENTSRQVNFVFYTTDNKHTIEQSYVIDGCKVKSIVLTKDKLMLLKN